MTRVVHLFHLGLGNVKKLGYNYASEYAVRDEELGLVSGLSRYRYG